jgi:hypothetical protein
MTYIQAIEFLQDHLDSLEEKPEVFINWGDCIVAIHDYVTMLEASLITKQARANSQNEP